MPVRYSSPVKAASLFGEIDKWHEQKTVSGYDMSRYGMNRRTFIALQKLRPEPQGQLQSRKDVQ